MGQANHKTRQPLKIKFGWDRPIDPLRNPTGAKGTTQKCQQYLVLPCRSSPFSAPASIFPPFPSLSQREPHGGEDEAGGGGPTLASPPKTGNKLDFLVSDDFLQREESC